MTLAPGTRIGPYEVTGYIGAGGMGEVYRARDTKLSREVALKVLPQFVAGDTERLARFEREARMLASLNHPHVAQLYGFEDTGGTPALAMELVEGEDLAQVIARGPIPLDEALAIARQMADALESAHEQGIIHRDLKPSNIKVREDGAVKVLDFGLAKALDPGTSNGNSELSQSPTITSPAMTERGVILGTAAYMSPEQAKGRVVDKRADIWAFGCVLYEMLTGRRAFAGDDVSDTFALVLKGTVDWTGVPAPVQRLLRKCLERDPKKRLHDIGDAWDLIDAAPAVAVAGTQASRPWLAWATAGVLLIVAAGLAAVLVTSAPADDAVVRFHIPPPPDHLFDIYITLSPDGHKLAFTARDQAGIVSLWVRDLDSLEARKLPGTEGAWSPFWSPDSRFVAFGVDRVLKKVAVGGTGSPESILEHLAVVGLGSWNADGVIVFGSRGIGGLWRVPANGGVPVPLTQVDQARGEGFHAFPFFLPDGRHFVYFRQSSRSEVLGIYEGSIDLPSDRQSTTRLAATNLGPVLAVSGHMLYQANGALVAQPFDPVRRQVTGEPARLAEQIGSTGSFAAMAASPAVLAYRRGLATATNTAVLTWMDRRGQRIGTVGEPRTYASTAESLAISPDGTRAVFGITPTLAPPADLWLLEFGRAIFTRFTFDPGPEGNPVWSPDGKKIAFRSTRGEATSTVVADMYEKDVSGTSDEIPLLPSPINETPTDWSPDGRFLLFHSSRTLGPSDVSVLPAAGKTAVPLLRTQFSEAGGRFSPDGKWMAYVSNESGRAEVYIRPFLEGADGTPSLGARWQVSNDGGTQPRWRRDGRELFYRSPTSGIMAADVTLQASSISTSVPRRLFDPGATVTVWDVMPDGQRFLLAVPIAPQTPDPITVVLNWPATLNRR